MRVKKTSSKHAQKGFTLIEMMVVVVVIGLLAAMIGPRLFNQVEKAQRVRIKQDIRAIESALKFYRLDNYSYPSQSDGLEALLTAPGGSSGGRWNGPYLEEVPVDRFQQPLFQFSLLVLRAFLDQISIMQGYYYLSYIKFANCG